MAVSTIYDPADDWGRVYFGEDGLGTRFYARTMWSVMETRKYQLAVAMEDDGNRSRFVEMFLTPAQVQDLKEALHPYGTRPGTVGVPNAYFIAETGTGDRALWRHNPERPEFPTLLFAEYENRELWNLLVEGRFPEGDPADEEDDDA